MGMAAALGATQRGFDVTVLEKGEVGESLRTWGPTRFFSPLEMNIPRSFHAVLDGSLPPADSLLTGSEMAERVLKPLAFSDPLRGKILTKHPVIAVGRRGLTKQEFAGHPMRAERPFRVLADSPRGEKTFEAEIVLDATGAFMIPAAMGAGGLPATGERAFDRHILRSLGALDRERESLKGKRILLSGHGHSAANALIVLETLARQNPGTRIVWAFRSIHRRPCTEVCGDPLPERQAIVSRTNELAENPPAFLSVRRGVMVESLQAEGASIAVRYTSGSSDAVDRIVAMTGYRPDNSFLSELNVELSPVTEGTARLHRAIACVTDCLSVPKVELGDLQSGEPGFYLIGSKSYGRSRTFLLRNGLAHLETILDSL